MITPTVAGLAATLTRDVRGSILQGIELTPTLLPNQKEAIASARRAIKRIEERNQRLAVKVANPPNGELSHCDEKEIKHGST